jgi:hypothetical protein
LGDAGQLGAERVDLRVKQRPDESTKLVYDFQGFVHFDRTNFNDFYGLGTAPPTGGLQVVYDEMTFLHVHLKDTADASRLGV